MFNDVYFLLLSSSKTNLDNLFTINCALGNLQADGHLAQPVDDSIPYSKSSKQECEFPFIRAMRKKVFNKTFSSVDNFARKPLEI